MGGRGRRAAWRLGRRLRRRLGLSTQLAQRLRPIQQPLLEARRERQRRRFALVGHWRLFLCTGLRWNFQEGESEKLASIGYDVEALWRESFAERLGDDQVYLDHAGSTLYSAQQLDAAFQLLRRGVFANPHSASASPSAQHTAVAVAQVRDAVLAHFGVDRSTHELVFTANATAGAKLVAESFFCRRPDDKDSRRLLLTGVNHTSIVGMREYATAAGCAVSVLHSVADEPTDDTDSGERTDLLAVPLQCNFTGSKLDVPALLRRLERRRAALPAVQTLLLVDASAWVGHARLDLTALPADFAVLSFYKMFGYPTGVGALIVRRQAARHLAQRPYFGGGTVAFVSVRDGQHALRDDSIAARFEDGTLNFLDVLSVPFGLQAVQRLGLDNIERHCHDVTQYCYRRLTALAHGNGTPLLAGVFGEHACNDAARQGPVVCFTVQTAQRQAVSHSLVGRLAAMHNIHLRTGAFCNPGAAQQCLQLTDDDARTAYALVQGSHAADDADETPACWDRLDTVGGKPTGAVRVSFGYMSRRSDVDRLVDFLVANFVDASSAASSHDVTDDAQSLVGRVQHLAVYPIKSCAAFVVPAGVAWPLGPHGLLFDRHWTVVDAVHKRAVQQKQCPALALVTPQLDLVNRRLRVTAAGCAAVLDLSLDDDSASDEEVEVRACGRAHRAALASDAASEWFSALLGRPCRLVANRTESGMSFANDSHLLVLSTASLRLFDVQHSSAHPEAPRVDWTQFRPNVVVHNEQEFASQGSLQRYAHREDSWAELALPCGARIRLQSRCARCRMINISPADATADPRPTTTLARYRSHGSQIFFGAHYLVAATAADATLCIGEPLYLSSIN